MGPHKHRKNVTRVGIARTSTALPTLNMQFLSYQDWLRYKCSTSNTVFFNVFLGDLFHQNNKCNLLLNNASNFNILLVYSMLSVINYQFTIFPWVHASDIS